MRYLLIILFFFGSIGYSQNLPPGNLSGKNYGIYYWITSKLGIPLNILEIIFTIAFIAIVFFLIYHNLKKSND